MALKIKEDEFNIKLIQLIEERPCLYDYNRADYSNRNVQDAAWLEISTQTNESVADCKERWKNLRGCYTRHLKKLTRLSGTNNAKHFRPYYLADQLKFLYKFTKPRPPRGVLIIEPREDMDQDQEKEEAYEIYEYSDNSRELETPPPGPSGPPEPPAPSLTEIKPLKEEPNNWDTEGISTRKENIKKHKKVTLSEVNACALEFFKSRQKSRQYNRNQDPDFAFLFSLLPDVKDMNREQKRRFKTGVLNLLSDIYEENPSGFYANP